MTAVIEHLTLFAPTPSGGKVWQAIRFDDGKQLRRWGSVHAGATIKPAASWNELLATFKRKHRGEYDMVQLNEIPSHWASVRYQGQDLPLVFTAHSPSPVTTPPINDVESVEPKEDPFADMPSTDDIFVI